MGQTHNLNFNLPDGWSCWLCIHHTFTSDPICRATKTRFCSTELALWPCVDHIIHIDGHFIISGVGGGQKESYENSIESFQHPAAVERDLVSLVCRFFILRFDRNNYSVGCNPIHNRNFLQSLKKSWNAITALYFMGEYCNGLELLHLDTQHLTLFKSHWAHFNF